MHRKKAYLFTIVVVVVLVSFGVGFSLGKIDQRRLEIIEEFFELEKGKPEGVDFSVFWEAWRALEQHYVDRENLDWQKMVHGAIAGMLKSLGDPYTLFMDPQETHKFSEDIKGKFEGIGAEIGIRKGILTIIAPLEGSPAKRAGLRAGDKILKVDDILTADLTIDEAVTLIRGEKGTEVVLTILRDDGEEPQEIKIIREEIKIPVIKLEIKDGLAHIQLYHFTENIPGEFKKVAQKILSSDVEGIILDLRDNPGGYLETAVEITSWFLPTRSLVVVEDFGEGVKEEHYSYRNGKLVNFPLIVLVNQGSASGSEIVAGALRDIRGIKLIGEKTFGKGSVQQFQQLKDKSSMKITVAKWLTPSGACIRENGLEPDIKVERSLEDFEAGRDPQLDKAIELLK